MKDYWQLREVLSEAKRGNWVRPSDASIRKEYQIEYLKHLIHELPRNIFPTEAEFVKAVKSAPTMQIDSAADRKIHNRSRTRDMEELLDLISGYRSFPKFRNEDTLKELEKLIKAGKPVDMPIVVKFPKGDMRVLAGNTRMDIAFMNGINPTVVMLDLTPHMRKPITEMTDREIKNAKGSVESIVETLKKGYGRIPEVLHIIAEPEKVTAKYQGKATNGIHPYRIFGHLTDDKNTITEYQIAYWYSPSIANWTDPKRSNIYTREARKIWDSLVKTAKWTARWDNGKITVNTNEKLT